MHFSTKKLNFVGTDYIISYLYIRDTVISQEEAEQLMCPPSPNGDLDAKNEHPPRLQRLNSIHVGPVQLPHPVRMPNGRVRNNSKIRSCSEDNSSKHISFPEKTTYDNVATVAKSPPRSERRALSLKQSSLDHRQIIDDLTYMYFEGGGKH